MKYIFLLTTLIPWAGQALACDPAFFAYSSPICLGAGTALPDTVSTPNAYFIASSPGISITGWGAIDLANSSPGTYNIGFLVNDSCQNFYSGQVTLLAASDASFAYGDSAFCKPGQVESPILLGDTGGVFHGPTGLAIDSTNGQINVSLSASGIFPVEYTVTGPCPDTAQYSISIQTQANANFFYPDSSFCGNEPDPAAIILGDLGGSFFSCGPGPLLDSLTGQIDLSASSPGVFEICYSVGTACADTDTVQIKIVPAPNAFFTYPPLICQNQGANPLPVALNAGIFSEPTGFLQFVNAQTGEIDLASSPVGVYLVLHTTSGTCPDSSVAILHLQPKTSAAFYYPDTTYCNGDVLGAPVILGQGGGLFNATPAGLALDTLTGFFDPSQSNTGTFEVSYHTLSPCPDTSTFTFQINPQANPAFQYFPSVFCVNDPNPYPQILGDTGGVFSVFWGNGWVDSLTGEIDLSASQAGDSCLIQYRVAGQNGQCSDSSLALVSILEPSNSVSVTYAQADYCPWQDDPAPVVSGPLGGTFQAFPSSLVFTSAYTGQIDLSATPPGTYLIRYYPPGSCTDSSNGSLVTIHYAFPLDLHYPQSEYCTADQIIAPQNLNSGTGSFSTADSGLTFVDSTLGTLDLSDILPGYYLIKYTSGGVCSQETILPLTIHQSPEIALVSTADNETICEGEEITFFATGADRYLFYVGDSIAQLWTPLGQFTPGQGLANGAQITVLASADPGGCEARDSLTVTVRPRPEIIDLQSPQTVTSEASWSISGQTSLDTAWVHWWFEVQESAASLKNTSPTFVKAQAGSFSLSTDFELVNPNTPAKVTFYLQPELAGCNGETDTLSITFMPTISDIFIPGLITPNGDGKNDGWEIRYLDHIQPDQYQITVFNRAGGPVFRQEGLSPGWNGSGLPDGVYWYVVSSLEGDVASGGVTIRR
ncbi:MAG: gliding motility-associated C-terminal domain-containing protein [Bacteroidia bacterium]|nr:gliding motility-associated C-terminal domain-containing protein [Bacteroidia bacterium]